ncbi:MAG: alpha/beta fold hydrolase [Anaerolineales bacterium]|nr:alpha/beta fold hydrolase [Anaerolineales bacterium]
MFLKKHITKDRTWRYWLKLVGFGLIVFLILGNTAYIGLYAYASTRPTQYAACCITPADKGFDYKDVSLTTDDGLELAGWYIPSQNRAAVILLHGYGGNRLGMMFHAEALANQGYGVLFYDQRASGESEGGVRSWGWLDVADVDVALAYLQARPDIDADKIGIFGSSTGAEIALAAAALNTDIAAVGADGPGYTVQKDAVPPQSIPEAISYFDAGLFVLMMQLRSGASAPQPLTEAVAQISPRPLLLISTSTEFDFERRMAEQFYNLAGEPKAHWHIPEAGHGGGPSTRPEEYTRRLLDFYDQAFFEE